jgi:uncharacterized protein YprB with RNaseH-like and TPR domain
MRDLASRLRAIVRQPIPGRPSGGIAAHEADAAAIRELTYVPDVETSGLDLDVSAAALGGTRYVVGSSACVAIDRVWQPEQSHGRWRVRSYAIDPAAPIGLFDARVGSVATWASRVVVFDIETTSLGGGAGTLPLIAGCGWFEDGAFRVRQFFLNGPAGEQALLDGLARIFNAATLLVTYNGRTFDVPVMETRWAYHRQENAAEALPHFDMLPVARRLWGGTTDGCALSALERSVLRFHRFNDVPGLEIPSRYFQFLRTGDPSVIEGVLEHNRHDLISTAAVMAQALRLAADGPEACETPREQLGLARLYEGAGDLAAAERGYRLASASDDREIAAPALARLAGLLRRQSRFQEAVAAWRSVLTLSGREATWSCERAAAREHTRAELGAWVPASERVRGAGDAKSSGLMTLERRATEALAIHHEHRARDLDTARRYAEALRADASGRGLTDADRRLGRLDRKIKRAESRDRLPL